MATSWLMEWLDCCKSQANGDGQSRPSKAKASLIVVEGYRKRIGMLFLVTSTMRFYNGMGVHLKKNCEGFPMLFTFKNFKSAFLSDMKQWWSRH
jgi:hypothetical protein